jgi:hypothetical protein
MLVPYAELTSSVALGRWGENAIRSHMQKAPMLVCSTGQYKPYDLALVSYDMSSSVRFEIKTATRSKSGWQYCLHKSDKHGHTNCANSDYVLLVPIVGERVQSVFLIPSVELSGKKKISMRTNPSKYSGKYSKYRVQLPELNDAIATLLKQTANVV